MIAIGLVVVASLTILLVDWLASTISVSYGVRRVYAGTLLFLLVAFLIVVFGRYGFPPTLARKAYDSFNVTGTTGDDLNSRLFNLSGSGRAEPWRRLGEAQALSGNLADARVSFRRAIEKDRRDWTLWYELALASRGVERQRALAQASRLNPRDPRLQG